MGGGGGEGCSPPPPLKRLCLGYHIVRCNFGSARSKLCRIIWYVVQISKLLKTFIFLVEQQSKNSEQGMYTQKELLNRYTFFKNMLHFLTQGIVLKNKMNTWKKLWISIWYPPVQFVCHHMPHLSPISQYFYILFIWHPLFSLVAYNPITILFISSFCSVLFSPTPFLLLFFSFPECLDSLVLLSCTQSPTTKKKKDRKRNLTVIYIIISLLLFLFWYLVTDWPIQAVQRSCWPCHHGDCHMATTKQGTGWWFHIPTASHWCLQRLGPCETSWECQNRISGTGKMTIPSLK